MDQLIALLLGKLLKNPLEIFQPGDVFTMGKHKFRVLQLVGVGGAGAVYKCCSPSFPHDVCVKVTKASYLTDEEIQFMLMLHQPPDVVIHPNLLPLLAYSTIKRGDRTYQLLCMPFVEGGAVGHKRREEPAKFTEGVIKAILYDVASGLAVLHDKEILHGDISPWNILLEKWSTSARGNDVSLELKALLCDFGISRRMGDDGSTPIKGYHPVFSAPEVVNGTATYAADVYSLGATMVHLLYGVNDDFLTNAGRVQSEDLRTILEKCLSSDPSHRYANAKALWLDGLEGYRWAKVEERLPRTLKDRFVQIYRAKKDFWMGVGAAVVGDFTLVATGTGTAPCFSTTTTA